MRARSTTSQSATAPAGGMWVTRRNVYVDRIASAWLIRRFIDPMATFKFVPPRGYTPKAGELRFDMYQGEYTHVGDRCTFVEGSFFESLPAADVYVLSTVLHDWGDEAATRILRTIRAHAPPGGALREAPRSSARGPRGPARSRAGPPPSSPASARSGAVRC